MIKYTKWFYPDPCRDIKLGYTNKLYRYDQIRIISQFRMGCHWLYCETLRKRLKVVIPRSQRICEMCDFNQRKDEMHIFECPFYNDIGLKFQAYFLDYWGILMGTTTWPCGILSFRILSSKLWWMGTQLSLSGLTWLISCLHARRKEPEHFQVDYVYVLTWCVVFSFRLWPSATLQGCLGISGLFWYWWYCVSYIFLVFHRR